MLTDHDITPNLKHETSQARNPSAPISAYSQLPKIWKPCPSCISSSSCYTIKYSYQFVSLSCNTYTYEAFLFLDTYILIAPSFCYTHTHDSHSNSSLAQCWNVVKANATNDIYNGFVILKRQMNLFCLKLTNWIFYLVAMRMHRLFFIVIQLISLCLSICYV